MLSERQLFHSHLAPTSDIPLQLEVDRAEGVYLYDKNGASYIDLIAGISVSSLGHRHPKVLDGIRNQLDHYMHTMVYGEHVLSPQVEYAKLLAEHLPDHLTSCYFVNSGAEATEGAMKLAKRVTGRPEIVSCKNAYHGSSQGALSIMGDEYFKQPFRPLLPGTRQITFNREEDLDVITEDTACVIIETVQAESGVIKPHDGYLKKVRQRCNEQGALLVFDEIQVGMGRTGSLFAFEQYEVEPDIILLAKAFGGGLPLGAFIASQELMAHLKESPVLGHITTFGGNPVCCAAGLASFQVIADDKISEKVSQKEAHFLHRLKHAKIRDVRSAGLILAIEFVDFEQNKRIIDECINQGVIVDWFLFAPHCMRLAPPLNISEDEIDRACSAILQCIEKLG